LDSGPDELLNALLVEVMEPTSASEEEDEELDLISARRKVAESVGAPVSTCATLFLHGRDLLFERTAPKHPLIMGRHPASEIVVTENSVSRRHAELTYRDDAWFIRDLDSKSGTQVNGETVTGTTRLKEGDQVKLGKVKLNVSFSLPMDINLEEGASAGVEAPPGESGAPDETPVLAGGLTDDKFADGVPTINVVRDEESGEKDELDGSTKSGRTETMKRRMDIQDRREAERIKTVGIVGVSIIAVFGIVGIISTVNRPPKPKAPPSPEPTASSTGTEIPPEGPTPKQQLNDGTPASKSGGPRKQAPGSAPVETQKATVEPAPQPVKKRPATEADAVEARRAAEAGEDGEKAEAAAAVERLPPMPEPLPSEVSPFEPRWFAGPGRVSIVTRTGETVKGVSRIDGETLHVDAAGVSTTMKLADVKQLIWDGARAFTEADRLLEGGDYGRAAGRYAEAIREAEASLRTAGADSASFPGRWYAEGRRRECLLKADHLQYCQAVFNRLDLATPEQLNVAGNAFARLATTGANPGAEPDEPPEGGDRAPEGAAPRERREMARRAQALRQPR